MRLSAVGSMLVIATSFVGVAAADDPAPGEGDTPPKIPKQGDFDAGGQTRFPSGPDETGGNFKSFNWVALDLKGRYYIMDKITADLVIPLAIVHPDPDGEDDPRVMGGVNTRIDAMFGPVGLGVTLAYMREGAMLLGEKDYPLFKGGFKPGIAGGPIVKMKLGKTFNLTTMPNVIFQSGTTESITAIQVPVSLWLKLGTLLQVSADVGVNTGDDFALGATKGGRIALGASVTAKIGPIQFHLGGGVASLLAGVFNDEGEPAGPYPSILDSVYFDLNVKYVK